MMLNKIFSKTIKDSSCLFNESNFYKAFLKDVYSTESELIIESPFITLRRSREIVAAFKVLRGKRVRVIFITRPPSQHETRMRQQALEVCEQLQLNGVRVLYVKDLHRKIATIDRQILWEGSLNILSHNCSSEIMRRIQSERAAWEMIRYTKIDEFAY